MLATGAALFRALGPHVHCPDHARGARAGAAMAGALLLFLGVLVLGVGTAITIQKKEPVILAIGPIGVALVVAAVFVFSRLRKLPPVPPS